MAFIQLIKITDKLNIRFNNAVNQILNEINFQDNDNEMKKKTCIKFLKSK